MKNKLSLNTIDHTSCRGMTSKDLSEALLTLIWDLMFSFPLWTGSSSKNLEDSGIEESGATLEARLRLVFDSEKFGIAPASNIATSRSGRKLDRRGKLPRGVEGPYMEGVVTSTGCSKYSAIDACCISGLDMFEKYSDVPEPGKEESEDISEAALLSLLELNCLSNNGAGFDFVGLFPLLLFGGRSPELSTDKLSAGIEVCSDTLELTDEMSTLSRCSLRTGLS